jgi:hypothetical protein
VELGAARACGERRPEIEFTAVASMADGGGSEPVASRAAAVLAPFINIRALGRGSQPTRTSAKGQGMGTEGSTARRSTAPTP